MEKKVDSNSIVNGVYKTDSINPSLVSTYARNSFGTIVVDANESNVDSKQLVINLVGTRYLAKSFNNVLDVDFEEFLDPEIVVPEEQSVVQDLSATVNELTNQTNNLQIIIDSQAATIEALQSASLAAIAVTEQTAIDISAEIQQAISAANNQENKKPRILSDNTFLRDSSNDAFFYIMENGKKRRFTENSLEVVRIAADAVGKLLPNGTVDFIQVSDGVLDDIPTGAPFTAFDLVKDKPTDTPPALDLGGKQIAAKWIAYNNTPINGSTQSNPIEITAKSSDLSTLKVELELQMASSVGSINYYYFLDLPKNADDTDVDGWFPGRVPLQEGRLDIAFPTSRKFTVSLKDASLGALRNIPISATNPEFILPITAKLYNESDGQGFSDTVYFKIKLISNVPTLTNKSLGDAENTARNAGYILVPNIVNSSISSPTIVNNRIFQQSVTAGTALAAGSTINVDVYRTNRVVPNFTGLSLSEYILRLINRNISYQTRSMGIIPPFGIARVTNVSIPPGNVVNDNETLIVEFVN